MTEFMDDTVTNTLSSSLAASVKKARIALECLGILKSGGAKDKSSVGGTLP